MGQADTSTTGHDLPGPATGQADPLTPPSPGAAGAYSSWSQRLCWME